MNKLKQLIQKINPNFFNSQSVNSFLFYFLILLLPTQLGKHFFIQDSFINGVRVDYLAPTVFLTDIIIALLTLINIKIIIKSFTQKNVLIIISLILLNVLFAQSKPIALYKFIKLIEIYIAYILAKHTKISSKNILIGFSISGFMILVLSILQITHKQSIQGIYYFFGERFFSISTPGIAKAILDETEFLRPYATFSHPNSLAGFYLLIYVFALTYKIFKKHFILRLTLFNISAVLILLSFSKTAIAGFIIITLVYQFQNKLISCRWCTFAKLVIFIPLILIIYQTKTDMFTIQKRIELIQNAVSIIQKHPVFGVGIGNYLIAQKYFSSTFYLFYNQPVHNIFLLYFAELGIFIGGLIIIINRKILRKCLVHYPLICLVFIITGFFDHYWFTLQQNILLIGVVFGSLRRSRN
jgi:hypothetical protein